MRKEKLRGNKWENNLNRRYIWSYVAVLFATLVLVFFAVATYSGRILKDELRDFSQARAEDSLDQLDRMVQETRSIALQVSTDVSMSPFFAQNDKVREVELIRNLYKLKAAGNGIADVLLHYTGSEVLFCSDAKRSLAYMDHLDEYGFLSDTASSVQPQLTTFNASDLAIPTEADQSKRALAVTCGIPFGSKAPYATVTGVFPIDLLHGLFANFPQGAGYALFLTEPDGTLFYSEDMNMDGADTQTLYLQAAAGARTDSRYELLKVSSEETGITAYIFVEDAVMFSKVTALSRILFVISFAAFLLAVAVNIRISRRNIAPLKNLREFLTVYDLPCSEEDPLGLLTSVRRVYSDNLILTEQLALRQKTTLNNVLLDLFSGMDLRVLQRRIDALGEMGVTLEAPEYVVLYISITDKQVIADKAALELDEQIASGRYRGRMFTACREEKNAFTVLVLFDGTEAHGVTAAIAFIERVFDDQCVPIKITAGSVEKRLEDIQISASKALALMDEGATAIRRYPSERNPGWQFWHAEGQVVRQLIVSNSPAKACDYFATILDRVDMAYASHTARMTVATAIAASIVEGCLPLVREDSYLSEIDWIGKVSGREQLEKRMRELIEKTCLAAYSQKQHADAALLKKIVAYVDDNFTREQLSLELLSEHFDVSIYFISKFFQEAAGENFNTYLSGLRMNHAKKLLRDTDMTLREITSKVGYVDESSFSRKFKTMFGVTPGQYRKQTGAED